MFAIRAGTILTPNRILKEAYIAVEDDRIVNVSGEKPKDAREVYRYDEHIVSPGFVDIHTHGSFGVDTTYSSSREILDLSKILPSTGVTSYFPSIMTESPEQMKDAIRNIREALESKNNGSSKILGTHLEGPYLNPAMCGAQPKEHIRKPSLEEFNEFYKLSGGTLKRITVAPEIDGGIEFIKDAVRKFEVKVSLGHTDATYEQTIKAIEAGASIITHLYNGMRGFHHREPGIVGAALTENVYVEVIVDFIHLHPATVNLVMKCKGSNRTILVTDSISGAGLGDGVYKLGSRAVTIKDGVARLSDGALAGSMLTMIGAVQNAVKSGMPLRDAVKMAALTPCNAMGIKDSGKIVRGCKADFIVLDKQMRITDAFIDGRRCEDFS
ncbi:N-acetylglucosamine-6-phosphate deacetylase [Candidatus Bathyarchaeota archaeon]|nr:N-acetylglucosamine-6-phosphate deacetylase [Candidatus Bathyarchaeota archaeon]